MAYNHKPFFIPVTSSLSADSPEIFMIAGGGGGGSIIAGGGGAGGYWSGSLNAYVPGIKMIIEIGAGGAGSIGYANPATCTNGSITCISGSLYRSAKVKINHVGGLNENTGSDTIVSIGGGRGMSWSNQGHTPSNTPLAGSSGGGSGTTSSPYYSPGNLLYTSGVHGYSGGQGSGASTTDGSGGGGGGATAAGANGTDAQGGTGGAGVFNSISGSNHFGGGGGGGTRSSTGQNYGIAGIGGGGRGGYTDGAAGVGNIGQSSTGYAENGAQNTGGGGGGGGYLGGSNVTNSGAGGSGLVLIKVKTTKLGPVTGGVSTHIDGDYTIVKFYSSGTILLTG